MKGWGRGENARRLPDGAKREGARAWSVLLGESKGEGGVLIIGFAVAVGGVWETVAPLVMAIMVRDGESGREPVQRSARLAVGFPHS